MKRVRIDDEWIDVPDDTTPEDLAALADSQDEPAADDLEDDSLPVVAAAPVPVARVAPLPSQPAVAATAPLPPVYRNAAQGSRSNWILPDQLGRIGVVSPPPGVAPTAPLPPGAAAAPAYDPLSSIRAPAATVAPPGAVTRGPDLPPPEAATGPTQRMIKVNGKPMPVPDNWDTMDDDAKGDFIDAQLMPQTLPDILNPQQPRAESPASILPQLSPLLEPAVEGPLPLPEDVNSRLVPTTSVGPDEMPQGSLPGAARTRPEPIVGQRMLPLPMDVEAAAQDKHSAYVRGLVRGLGEEQPAQLGEAFEGLSYLTENPDLRKTADALRSIKAGPEYARKGKGILDARTWDELWTAAGETAGSGTASTAPSVLSSMVLGYLGKRYGGRLGALGGGMAGAAIPSAALNYGDTFKTMKEAGIPPGQAAIVAAWATGPITGLDVVGVEGMAGKIPLMKGLKRWAEKEFARRIAAKGLQGATFEGVTEAMQQVIQEGVASFKAGKPVFTEELGKHALEAGIGGALVGGPGGAVSGVLEGAPQSEIQQFLNKADEIKRQNEQNAGKPVSPEVQDFLRRAEEIRQRQQQAQPPPPSQEPGPASALPAPQGGAVPAAQPPDAAPGEPGRPPAPGAAFSLPEGIDRATLPKGMRNNNPGNIKWKGQPGTTRSSDLDQGDPQANYPTVEAGMTGMRDLILRKFDSGKHTIRDLIMGEMGWTPGSKGGAEAVARFAGIDPDQQIDMRDPAVLAKVMRGIITQEQGPEYGRLYPDSLIQTIAGTELPPAQPGTSPIAPEPGAAPAEYQPGKQPKMERVGRPNFASNATHGDPTQPGWQEQNLETVDVGGQKWQVHKLAAPHFRAFLEELAARGYPLKSSGGYNYRPIRGSKTKLSQHSWGNAIDLNAEDNPLGSAKNNLPPDIREIAARHGLVWGGDFKGRKDNMHFEWGGGDMVEQPAQAGTGPQQPSTAAAPVTTLPGEAGAASTASAGSASTGAPASGPTEPAFTWAHSEPQTSPSVPEFNQLETDAGKIQTRPIVVDMDDIVHSGQEGYDPALQPRDRDRAASQAQVASIAGKFDPRQVTALTGDASTGPPIVNHRGQVESGNGRTMALEQVYAQGGGEAYRQQLKSMGFNIDDMERPILVQQRMTPLKGTALQGFVQGANASRTLRMGTAEQARADARRLSPEVLQTLAGEGAARTPAGSPAFRRAFMQGIAETERAALQDKDGKLTAEGQRRLNNAVMTAAYGESPAIERIQETTDDNTKALSASLMEAAPEMAKLRAGIRDGSIDPSVESWIDAIPAAVQRISDLREQGQNPISALDQQDAFNPIAEEEELWIRDFLKPDGKPRAKKDIDAALRFYAEEAVKASRTGGLDLGTPAVTPRDIQARAGEIARGGRNRAENTAARSPGGANQSQLFGANERGGDRGVPEQPAAGPQDRGQEPGQMGGGQADQAGERRGAEGRAPDQAGEAVKPKKTAPKRPKPQPEPREEEEPADIESEAARSAGAAAVNNMGPAGGKANQRRESVGQSLMDDIKDMVGVLKTSFSALKPTGKTLAGDETAWQRIQRLGGMVGYSEGGRLRAFARIYKSEALKTLSDMFQTTAGDFSEKSWGGSARRSQSFDLAMKEALATDTNEIVNLLRPLGVGTFFKFNRNMKKLGDAMRSKLQPAEPEIAQALADMKEFFARKLFEMKDAGVDVNDVGPDYYRRMFDRAEIQKDTDRFIAILKREYQKVGKTAAEAADSAKALATAILWGDVASMQDFGSFSAGLPGSSILKERKLLDSADEALAEFYINDPAEVMMTYSRQANLKMEQVRRLGPKGEVWTELMNQARAEGVPQEVREDVADIVSTIMGTNSDRFFTNRLANNVVDFARTASTLGMLDKAVFASLAETITPALRRGGFKAPINMASQIARTLSETMLDIARDSRIGRRIKFDYMTEAREFAEAAGLLMDSANVHLSAMRHTHDIPSGKVSHFIKTRFFRANILTQLTQGQKVGSSQQARAFIREQTRAFLRGSAAARDYLSEVRIPRDKMEEFSNFIWTHRNGMPSRFDLTGEMGRYYQNALHVFLSQGIMEPTAADKPGWMSTGTGSIIGQFAGFSWASGRNVIGRNFRLIGKAADLKSGWTAADRARALAIPLYSVAGLYLMGSLVRLLRDAIFDDERENRKRLTAGQQQLQILAQGGAFGPFEPLVTAAAGFSPTRGGGGITFPLQNLIFNPMKSTYDWYWNDTQSTNTHERKMARSYLDLLNPVWSAGSMFLPTWARTPAVLAPEYFKKSLIDELAGPVPPRLEKQGQGRQRKAESKESPLWRKFNPVGAILPPP